MGINHHSFEHEVVMSVHRHAPNFDDAAVTSTATSKVQLDALYRTLSENDVMSHLQ